jgi:hypothetical protein
MILIGNHFSLHDFCLKLFLRTLTLMSNQFRFLDFAHH